MAKHFFFTLVRNKTFVPLKAKLMELMRTSKRALPYLSPKSLDLSIYNLFALVSPLCLGWGYSTSKALCCSVELEQS